MFDEEEIGFVVEDDMFSEDEYMRNVEDHKAVQEFAMQHSLLRYGESGDEFRWY